MKHAKRSNFGVNVMAALALFGAALTLVMLFVALADARKGFAEGNCDDASDVLPRPAVDDPAHRAGVHPEAARQVELRNAGCVQASNFDDLRLGQLRTPVAATTCSAPRLRALTTALAGRCSALCNHVVHVGLTITDEQVCRVHARSVVALVQHPLTARDGATVDEPRDAVSLEAPPERAVLLLVRHARALHATPRPNPAGVGLVDARPEGRDLFVGKRRCATHGTDCNEGVAA